MCRIKFNCFIIMFIILILVEICYSISTNRSGNLFSGDEEYITLNTTLANGTNANWTLTNVLYNNESITGTSQVQNGRIQIPIYGLHYAQYTFAISGDGSGITGGIMPPILDYNPDLTPFVLCTFNDNDIVSNCIIAWNNATERYNEPYMWRQLGFREVRVEYMMDEFNPSAGNYVYDPNREAYFLACKNNFVRLSFKIVGAQSWNGGIQNEPSNYTNWNNAIRTFAQYYYPIGIDKYYFVGRADQQSWWWNTSQSNSDQKYVNFLNNTHTQLQSVNPKIRLVAPENWAYNVNFTDYLLQNGNFEVFSADFPCDTMDDFYAHSGFTFREMLKTNNWKPFINTEEGGRLHSWTESDWRKYYTGIAAQQITGAMDTSIMVQLDLGCHSGVFMLEDWSGLYEPFQNRSNSGQMTTVSELCWQTRIVADELAGTQLLSRIPNLPPNVMGFLYKRGNDRYLGAFTLEARVGQLIEINTSSSRLRIVDGFGNEYTAIPSAGKVRIMIGNLATFVHGLGENDTISFIPNSVNETPKIVDPGQITAVVGVPLRFKMDGYDPDMLLLKWGGRYPTWSLGSAPSGMTIRNSSGLIEWTPSTAGQFNATVRLTDSDGASASTNLTINVQPSGTNLPPEFISRPSPVAVKNGLYIYLPKARDPNGDTVTYSITQGPSGMQLVNSSVTWTPTTVGIYQVQITASDGKGGNTAQSFEIAVVPNPEVPADGDYPPRNPARLTVTGTSNGITLVWNKYSNCDTVIERSQSRTGPWSEIATTPNTWYRDPNPPAGNVYYRVKARNSTAESGYSNIVNGRNRAPIAEAGRSSKTSGSIQLDGTASFDPEGQTLTYSWRIVNTPHGTSASLTNANTATPTFNPGGNGKYIIELIVSDGEESSLPDYVRVYTGIGSNETVCHAGVTKFANQGSTTTFTGWSSSPNIFFWRLDDLPLGGYNQFNPTNQKSQNISLCANVPGVYMLFLAALPPSPDDWMVGYSDNTYLIVSPPISSDTTPPAQVNNLTAGNPTTNSITLTWTAPGDDGNTGTATSYNIRYATYNITESNWLSATLCSGVPAPKPAGQTETFVVNNLNSNTQYYFGLKAMDDANNWSPLSNIASATTLKTVATKLLLSANPTSVLPTGTSISTVTASICDSNNNLVSDSTATVTFTMTGPGTLVGTNPVAAVGGIATIKYQSSTTTGTVTVTGTSPGLTQGSVIITVQSNQPPNAPTNLKCNGQTNPKGINDYTPDLSWTFSDPDTGDTQSAYRVLVANSITNLNNNNGNMWDTNKVISTANTVSYSGVTLQQGGTYYWKVMTWDNKDLAGQFSQIASFSITTQITPIISVSTDTLDFGTLDSGQKATLTFDITNTGGGTLTGTLTSDQEWLTVDPPSFSITNGMSQTHSVTVDNSVLNQKEGQYTGTITITSNGGTATVNVILTATCVLVKPNPYNPNKGLLTFFGDGIVPGETIIKIYTLSGELVKQLRPGTGKEIVWDGKTENGEPVASGIYLYTYNSPKEKGVGKFTVIIK